MTPALVISLAQKKVKTTTSSVLWNSLYQEVMDEIFTEQTYRFSLMEIGFQQPAGTFEKVFDADATELALTKIISVRHRGVTQYSLTLPPIPIADPDTTDSGELTYWPVQDFYESFPNPHTTGMPYIFTQLRGADGVSGLRIGIYPLTGDERTYGVLGEFIPVAPADADSDTNEITILPRQFHRLLIHGIASMAAIELGMDRLAATERALFDRGLVKLRIWDSRNPKYKMRLQSSDESDPRRGPRYPSTFDRSVS